MSLDKMICVVTGATGSVGSAIVDVLLEKKARVVAVSHGETSELVETDTNHFTIKGDLANALSVQTIVNDILDRLGRIQVWINAVGGFQEGQPVEEASANHWKKMLSINFITTLNCCQAILPRMKEQHFGRIINFGGLPGEKGMALAAPYAVSKAAVHVLTKTIAYEGKDFNIIPCVLLPGIIDTPRNREAMPDADWDQWLKPRDIARTIFDLLEHDKFESDPDRILIPLKAKQKETVEEAKDLDIISIFDQVSLPETEMEAPAKEEEQPIETVSQEESADRVRASTEDEEGVSKETREDVSSLEKESPAGEESPLLPPEEIFDSKALNPQLATFTLAAVLKKQELYQQALDVLDILEQKGENPERIKQEREKILTLLEPDKATREAGEEGAEQPAEKEPDQDTAEEEKTEEDQEPGEEPQTIDPEMATFQTARYLKSRGSYHQALEMLEVLDQKGEDPERIKQEKQEIDDMLELVKEETRDSKEEVSSEEEPLEAELSTEEKQEAMIPPEGEEEVTDTESESYAEEQVQPATDEVEPEEPVIETEQEEAIEAKPEAPAVIDSDQQIEEEDTSAKPEFVEEEPQEAVSPEQEQAPTKEKKAPRGMTLLLLVILIIVTGYAIWDWLTPGTPFVSRVVPSEESSNQTEEIALSQFTFTTREPPGGTTGEITAAEGQSLLLPTGIGDQPLTGDTVRAAMIDTAAEIDERDTTTEIARVSERREEPPREEQSVVIIPEQANSVILPEESKEPETVPEAGEHKTVEKDTLEGDAAVQDPRELFNKAQYREAARLWRLEKSANPDHFTVVLEYACLNQTIRNAYSALNQPEDFFILPYQLGDRGCYIFCWGDFPDSASAEKRFREVPRWFEENGASPVIRPFNRLIR